MAQVQRWYKGYKYKGNPKELIKQISKKIQEHNLSQYIPILRLEKGAKSRKVFYFFLAIESEEKGKIPLQVRDSKLLDCPLLKIPAVPGDPYFTYQEIKPMVGVAHDVYDYTNPIPYKKIQKSNNDNPFDWIVSLHIDKESPNVGELSQRYEKLLYWLSALGSGTWESFKKACDALGLEEPKRILRRFRLLGHIESSLDGSRWSTAPTAFVEVSSESDSQEFILCGQRSKHLLEKLQEYTTVKISNQFTGDAPPDVRLQLDSLDELAYIVEQVRTQLGITITDAGNASLKLATVLPELTAWKQGLRRLQGIVPSLYEWRRFDGSDFVECSFCGITGMYQMFPTQESDRPYLTLFYDSETHTWQQGDWYGLRFLALHYGNHQCIAHYDPTAARLAIPLSQRWPELYERALVLASGRLPSYQRTEQSAWLIYENVGLDLVEQLTKKLYVTCEEDSTHARSIRCLSTT
ncbi:hypothetical protein QQ056_07860 [Oscillatoria laete-virens NRMC-F 0139]|nr:hypothetical protein [Oscillatoria laete-virens]MDL5053456.1 hypothetical protein [Oscillatoria laete-virens NRMC-F 0139]